MAESWMNSGIPGYRWLTDSQPSPGVANAFALGFQAKQNALDRELRMRELELRTQQQDMLHQLRTEELNAKRISQEGVAALAKVMHVASEKGYDAESEALFWKTAADYPAMMTRPEFKEFIQQFEMSRTAKLRRELLDSQLGGRMDLENLRQEHRSALLDEKYDRLSTLQENSQEARTVRDEILHLYKLEENEKKSRATSGVGRFDLPWTEQESMKAEMANIKGDLFAKPEDKIKRIEAVTRKFKAIAEEYAKKRNAPSTNAPQKILKFNPATGKFE